jgi:hypothetical protein
MTNASEESGSARPSKSTELEKLEQRIRAYLRKRPRHKKVRRELVLDMYHLGYTEREIVAELHSTPQTIGRDMHELRRRAAERQPAKSPTACAPLTLEDARFVVQRVRRLQAGIADDQRQSTLYHNLLKLEWAMHIRLFQTLNGINRSEEESNREEHDWTKLPPEQRRERLRQFGGDPDELDYVLGKRSRYTEETGRSGLSEG